MAPSDCPSAAQVRAELDRILASEIFTRSERLSAYLRFIVEQSLAGEGDALKEQVIAIELYGKGADFRTAADPIVRPKRLRQARIWRTRRETGAWRSRRASTAKGAAGKYQAR